MKVACSPPPRQNPICTAAGMNPSDAQSETEPKYFDHEEVDMSEQQFAASLDATPEKPQFEIDEAEQANAPKEIGVPEFVAAAEELPIPTADGATSAASGFDSVSRESEESSSDPVAAPEPDWRSMVSAKVNNYKARKPYQERYPSLRLQFDPPSPRVSRQLQAFAPVEEMGGRAEPASNPANETVLSPSPPLPDPPPRVVMEATARIIEFPRPAVPVDELAEPVIDRPRIVEAPELLPPPPAMGGILIEEQRETEPERRPGFDVPLQAATLNRRMAAGLFDAVLVMASVAVFSYVFIRINGTLPPVRPAALLAICLLGIFWLAYQYAFLVYSGKTPGLWAAKLHLAGFDGQPAARAVRRWRVLASVLSLVSLGLGYAWCFVDEDQLSWHDRITRTHLAPR